MVDCPFCGADQKSLTTWGESTIGGYYRWVQCQECFAKGPSASSKAHGQDSDETDAAAVEKWNDQWALQYLPGNVAAAASGGGFDPYNP
jgi:hypothetical protein